MPQGINFRSTNAFVTDGANEFCQNSDTDVNNGAAGIDYPTTSTQGNNVGWESFSLGGGGGISTRDRSTSGGANLSGCHFAGPGGGTSTYRVDLPSSGWKAIRLAMGDYNYLTGCDVELFDTNASKGILGSGTTGAATMWKDATGVLRTSVADWGSNNAPVYANFASTIARFVFNQQFQAVSVAHLSIANSTAPDSPSAQMKKTKFPKTIMRKLQ